MRKIKLVNNVSEHTNISKVEVLVTVEAVMNELAQALTRGESVFLRGFGTFHPKKRAAKIGRNIKRGLSVEIPEHYIPAFRPAKELKAAMKKVPVDKFIEAPAIHNLPETDDLPF